MQRAIGMVEFSSIARGIYAADQMVKVSEVDIVTASTSCPGKYIAIVHGDVAAVKTSVETGEREADEYYIDSMVIPNVHPQVFPSLSGAVEIEKIEAFGIIESFSIAAMLETADAILKAANLQGVELRLGNGLGGKAYFTYTGDVAAVKSGTVAGKDVVASRGLLVNFEVIPSPSRVLVQSLV
ncbi:BMC domain-containing protein [Hornefia butyriciproducens]|uniref:BMC domain-containing protein n=1 Tax=Hornefia butyriciproducens TaxID=2652293 RepID=UPI002A75AAC6|nr:BMC domain-containing protein [Hornefia butyriciproducens]MCI7327787.1 BMC domain-containing protein [Clostridiales bacterium]MDY2991264.1 BMC domain-containing protein [Hornefia butyriciproducens]